VDERRRPLTADELRRLRQALDPAARDLRATPLLGGLDWATYALDLETGDGDIRQLVVRRYDGPDRDRILARARRDWLVLRALEARPLPIPRPVIFDPGHLLGAPALVMTRVAGAPLAHPADRSAWIDSLAATLALIHATDPAGLPEDFPRQRDAAVDLADAKVRNEPPRPDPVWEGVVAALEAHVAFKQANAPVLMHHDFWFGNTLWSGERISGVVDWSEARIGDPGADVAYARGDLNIVLGPEAAELFRERYEARRGALMSLAFWDLRTSLPALCWLPDWVRGYHEVGLTELTFETARARLEAFIADALARLERGP